MEEINELKEQNEKLLQSNEERLAKINAFLERKQILINANKTYNDFLSLIEKLLNCEKHVDKYEDILSRKNIPSQDKKIIQSFMENLIKNIDVWNEPTKLESLTQEDLLKLRTQVLLEIEQKETSEKQFLSQINMLLINKKRIIDKLKEFIQAHQKDCDDANSIEKEIKSIIKEILIMSTEKKSFYVPDEFLRTIEKMERDELVFNQEELDKLSQILVQMKKQKIEQNKNNR